MPSLIRPIVLLKWVIVLVWLVMMGLLVQRIHLVPELTLSPSEELADFETWMSIFYQDQKVGYSEFSLSRSQNGYMLHQNTFLNLKLMGQVQELRTLTSSTVSEDMSLKSFNFRMSAGPVTYNLTGRMQGKTLAMQSMTGGTMQEFSLNLDQVPRLASGIIPYVSRQGLQKDQKFKVPVFDPSTLSSKMVTVTVEAQEKIPWEGRTVETFRLRSDFQDTQTFSWVDQAGRVLKEEGMMGFSLVRTTEQEAPKGLAGRADLNDLVDSTSVPVDHPIKDPRQVEFLKIRLLGVDLKGLDLDGGRQALEGNVVTITRETPSPDQETNLPIRNPEFEQYLEPTPFIQAGNPRIRYQAKKIAPRDRSPLAIIRKVMAWTRDHLDKRPTMSVPSAVDVLEAGVGDCNEHAVLAAALLRASGIPTRIVVGIMYHNGRFYYHAWLECYYGQWLAVDPLLGQVPADATHIRFLTGDPAHQTELVRIIGRLEVEVLESSP